jgi:hypothetical protein
LSTCGGNAEEEGCGEYITERLVWCLREDGVGEDNCEAEPLDDKVEFRLGSAEAKIVSNNEMPVPVVFGGGVGAASSTTFLSIADANKASRVIAGAGVDG